MSQRGKQLQFFATAIISGITAVAIFQTLKCQYQIYLLKRKSNKLHSLDAKSADEIHAPTSDQILVTGVLTASTSFKQSIQHSSSYFFRQNHVQDLVMRVNYKQPIYSNDSFDKVNYKVKSDITKIQYSQKIYIKGLTSYLKDKTNVGGIYVKNIDKQDVTRVMEILKWEQKRRNLEISQHLSSFFLMIIRAIATIWTKDSDVSIIRGIEVGTREVCAGIKVGASVSILGCVTLSENMELSITPTEIFGDRLSLFKEFDSKISNKSFTRNFWAVICFIGGIYVARRAFHYWKKHHK